MSNGLAADFVKRFNAGAEIRVESLGIRADSGVTVLFGPSGSGKTTILRCLAGLDRPDEGRIQFNDSVWFDAARNVYISSRGRQIGLVPQDYALFPHLTVSANVGYGLYSLSREHRRERVTDTMRWLGIEALSRRLPDELSGGEQQRVALARAIVCRPRLLLMDEPLSALDAPTRQRLRSELRHLLVQSKIPTILVTHDRLEALTLGDNLIVMHGGKILQQGPVHEVFSRPSNLTVADVVGVETVEPGRIVDVADGLATVVVGEVRLTALLGDLPLDTRDAYVCIRAEDIILSVGDDSASSPRNRLPAVVRTLVNEGPMVRVGLDCGFRLTALLTKQACETLALQVNSLVFALVKAPQVHIIPR